MQENSIVYIGAFPPRYGGVTVKNENLYIALKKDVEIKKVDLNLVKCGNIREIIRFIVALINRKNQFVIGVSARSIKRFCFILYHINRTSMKSSLLIIMGGTMSKKMFEDKKYRKYVRTFKAVYVETQGMMEDLQRAGLTNGAIYPNCRFRPTSYWIDKKLKRKNRERLKCVFFSMIQREKGVDIILEAAEMLPDIEFIFYGNITPLFEDEFYAGIDRLDNVSYMGVFEGSDDDVYAEISQYDILLLPTKWKTEGVPGILVEAKIAGLPCIVSGESYNAEIVRDGRDGIVLGENTGRCLADAIAKLDGDRELLSRLAIESARSADAYLIENNVSKIIQCLREE